MYPDWPESASDLMPLPLCDGPKLHAFDFQGPQKIKFLEFLGEGLHSFVFKIEIQEQVYALKLFRFIYQDDDDSSTWLGPEYKPDRSPEDLEMLNTFYQYSDPFNCECRAFGRLQETGNTELAVECFGYLLLDEEHERTMWDKFSNLELDKYNNLTLDFNGTMLGPGFEDVRGQSLGKSGRPPPIRGIVKEFGQGSERLRETDMRKAFQNVVDLHELGISKLDVGHRQFINGKMADFSMALTVPHFALNPELNPTLTPEQIAGMEYDVFNWCVGDYLMLDEIVNDWNEDHPKMNDQIYFVALPNLAFNGSSRRWKLRKTPARGRQLPYVFYDPRRYDWKASGASAGAGATTATGRRRSGRKEEGNSLGKPRARVPKKPRRVHAPRWHYDCDAKRLCCAPMLEMVWRYRDGRLYPERRHSGAVLF